MLKFERLREDISALPEIDQQLIVEFVAFLKQRYALAKPAPLHPLKLENEPFVGMWSNRSEIQDSTAWVRQIRQQHWRT